MGEKITRVLMVSPLPPPAGGIASWTSKYLEWTQNSSLDVDLVNTSVIGGRSKKINSKRIITDEIRRTTYILRKINDKVGKFNPHIVHINSSCARFGIIRDYLCTLLVNRKSTKLIVHYRCNIEDQIGNNKLQKFFFQKLSRKADANIVLNTPSKNFLQQESGKEGDIIPNFIESQYILDKPKIIKASIKQIAYVGQVRKTKGALEIIEVAKVFPKIQFKLAGPVSREVEALTIPENVVFLGQLNKAKVRELLNDSDVFLFPSYSEGFANALLEAMSMGLPIITTDVGANADMIEDRGGVLVRKRHYKEIVDAIVKLENSTYRKQISAWNINKVNNNYIIDSVMERIITIYEDKK